MKSLLVFTVLVLLSGISSAYAESKFDISKLTGEFKLSECVPNQDGVYKSYIITQPSADALHFEMTFGSVDYQARTTIDGIDGKTEVSMDYEDVTRILETSKASTISNGVKVKNTDAQFFSILFVPIHFSASTETYTLENDQLVVTSKYFAVLMGHRNPSKKVCRYDRVK